MLVVRPRLYGSAQTLGLSQHSSTRWPPKLTPRICAIRRVQTRCPYEGDATFSVLPGCHLDGPLTAKTPESRYESHRISLAAEGKCQGGNKERKYPGIQAKRGSQGKASITTDLGESEGMSWSLSSVEGIQNGQGQQSLCAVFRRPHRRS
jgi:hypothetical protein